jgi:hypothetical protein
MCGSTAAGYSAGSLQNAKPSARQNPKDFARWWVVDGAKMGKSAGNAVQPLELIDRCASCGGDADAFRCSCSATRFWVVTTS